MTSDFNIVDRKDTFTRQQIEQIFTHMHERWVEASKDPANREYTEAELLAMTSQAYGVLVTGTFYASADALIESDQQIIGHLIGD